MSGLSGLSAAVSVPEQWTSRHVRCCLAEGREGGPEGSLSRVGLPDGLSEL
jgi:hypothetical protein